MHVRHSGDLVSKIGAQRQSDCVDRARVTSLRLLTGIQEIAINAISLHISTSLVERQKHTMRMSIRRFTRLTNALSKKVENLRAAVSLHFAHYNFMRVNKSLRITPAMAAGVSDQLWSIEELIERIDAVAPPPKPRGPYKKRSA